MFLFISIFVLLLLLLPTLFYNNQFLDIMDIKGAYPIVVRLHLNFHLNFLLLLVKAGVTMLIFEVVFIPSDKQFIYKRAPGQKGT